MAKPFLSGSFTIALHLQLCMYPTRYNVGTRKAATFSNLFMILQHCVGVNMNIKNSEKSTFYFYTPTYRPVILLTSTSSSTLNSMTASNFSPERFRTSCSCGEWWYNRYKMQSKSTYNRDRPCGPTDKASDYGSGDSRFESWQGRFFFSFSYVLGAYFLFLYSFFTVNTHYFY